jgi:hypothetical protein
MSIIYDALKKIEKSYSVTPKREDKKDSPDRSKTKIYLVYILVVCLGAVIANIFFSFFPKAGKVNKLNKASALTTLPPQEIKKQPNTTAPPEAKVEVNLPPAPTETKRQVELPLVLNGVFFSQNEGYALINNRIMKEGDTIEGAVVKHIGLEEVDVEFEGTIIKLYTNR